MPARLVGGSFEIYKVPHVEKFRWQLKTREGTVLMSSVVSYPSKEAAERGIVVVLAVAGGAQIRDASHD